jgi:hypothetical protein
MSTSTLAHPVDPAPGSADTRAFPSESVATHSETPWQLTPVRTAGTDATLDALHALAPAVGSVEVTMSSPDAITHIESVGHVIPPAVPPAGGKNDSAPGSASRTNCQCGQLADGLREMTTLPARSRATHNETEGHDTEISHGAKNADVVITP